MGQQSNATAPLDAIGLTGADAGVIRARKRPVKDIDYGFVGDVERVDSTQFTTFLHNGLVPIVAPLTFEPITGSMLNTNADTIASVLAISLSKHFDVRLIFCFEKQGVLTDVTKEDSVIRNLNQSLYKDLLAKGSFHDGILPKLENAFHAIQSGVKEVLIGEHTHLLANTGYDTRGTLITQS